MRKHIVYSSRLIGVNLPARSSTLPWLDIVGGCFKSCYILLFRKQRATNVSTSTINYICSSIGAGCRTNPRHYRDNLYIQGQSMYYCMFVFDPHSVNAKSVVHDPQLSDLELSWFEYYNEELGHPKVDMLAFIIQYGKLVHYCLNTVTVCECCVFGYTAEISNSGSRTNRRFCNSCKKQVICEGSPALPPRWI